MDGGLRCRWPVVSFAGWARCRWRLVVLVTSAAETEIEARREETDGEVSACGLAHTATTTIAATTQEWPSKGGGKISRMGSRKGTVFFNIDDHGQMMGWE